MQECGFQQRRKLGVWGCSEHVSAHHEDVSYPIRMSINALREIRLGCRPPSPSGHCTHET